MIQLSQAACDIQGKIVGTIKDIVPLGDGRFGFTKDWKVVSLDSYYVKYGIESQDWGIEDFCE